jgi:hypothetical protein
MITARRMQVALLTLLCFCAQCTTGRAVESVHVSATPAERLFIATFTLDREIDELYQAETNRLLAICGVYGAACFSQHFVPARRVVAEVRSAPDAGSTVVGQIHAVLKVSGQEYGGLTIDLEVEAADLPERSGTWRNAGDWGYGIHVEGVRPQGTWVQVFGQPFPAQAWLSVEEPAFTAHVLPISGESLHLQSVRAASPEGVLRNVPDGSYMVMSTSQDVIEFRAEMEDDMSCRPPLETTAAMPPILRTTPEEFFSPDGTPRFRLQYQRGC